MFRMVKSSEISSQGIIIIIYDNNIPTTKKMLYLLSFFNVTSPMISETKCKCNVCCWTLCSEAGEAES